MLFLGYFHQIYSRWEIPRELGRLCYGMNSTEAPVRETIYSSLEHSQPPWLYFLSGQDSFARLGRTGDRSGVPSPQSALLVVRPPGELRIRVFEGSPCCAWPHPSRRRFKPWAMEQIKGFICFCSCPRFWGSYRRRSLHHEELSYLSTCQVCACVFTRSVPWCFM